VVVTPTTASSKQVIKMLETEGCFLARVKGSHHQFKHPTLPGLVTLKHPDGDIPKGTLNSIRKQAGWKCATGKDPHHAIPSRSSHR